jgi:hypothetical protein
MGEELIKLGTSEDDINDNIGRVLAMTRMNENWDKLKWFLLLSRREPYIRDLKNPIKFLCKPPILLSVREKLVNEYKFIDVTPRGCKNTLINMLIYSS